MSDIANKVETLMEAMPYLQKYQGKIIVIKYGGNAMINEELKDAVMHDVVLLKLLGMCATPLPTSCVLSRWCSSVR